MKFRKKPVVIEAFHYEYSELFEDADEFCDGELMLDSSTGAVFIETLEGNMCVTPGDWIIRGVKGELYPCKPDVFEQSYEPVEESS